ncbi:MAG: hypothetical protein J1F11_12335 [Oscillospiraceae bacterium]|nr:hypothetical protein [Oscillospiraceae bacterium]
MKRIVFKRTAAALAAVLTIALAMTGCKDKPGSEEEETTSSVSLTEQPVSEYNFESTPIKEGDDLAINKLKNKSPEDALPGGYKLMDFSEAQQAKIYVNGKSQIRIWAYNYKEDLLDMATWADSACANLRLSNIMNYGRDTDFSEPENIKICGFDGIRYDNEMTQYTQFDDEGRPIEDGAVLFSGRCCYFYSDQDAYAIIFETLKEDWAEQSAKFEEFINDLEVTKTEY